MKDKDRVSGWLDDLDRVLGDAAILVHRGRAAFDTDLALPLAFEALCNRVGDLAKKLMTAEPELFGGMAWRQAARNRDFVVHQYNRVDRELLWTTVSVSFSELRKIAGETRPEHP